MIILTNIIKIIIKTISITMIIVKEKRRIIMLLQLQITITKHVPKSNPKPPNPKERGAGPSSSFGLPRRAKGRRSERLRPGHIRRLRLRNVSAARPIRPSSLQRASEWVIKMGHKRPRQYPSSHAPELIASEPNISRAGGHS